MRRPLFEIGEAVILWPTNSAHLCGTETVVVDRKNGAFMHISTGEIIHGYHYKCTVMNKADLWTESALRKKHKPGDSFTKLLQDLKTPIKNLEPV